VSRRQTLLDGSDGVPMGTVFVVLALFLAVLWLCAKSWPRSWSEGELRRVAREECRAVLDGGP